MARRLGKAGSERKDMNMNTNSHVDTTEQDQGGGSLKDLSELITSANHKRYLQLVPSSLSDEDEEHSYDMASSPTSPGMGQSGGAGDSIPLLVDPVERERQINQWTEELEKVEGEIVMLRQVLGSKVRRANELKRNLGITPFKEFKHDLQSGLSQIKESSTYQKTTAAVKTASEKTSSAFTTMGAAVSRKLGDIKNSQAFKSMEEKVSTSYASVKSKVAGSKSTDDIDTAVQEAKEQEAGTPTSPTTTPPTDKVPL